MPRRSFIGVILVLGGLVAYAVFGGLRGAAGPAGEASFVSAFTWQSDDPDFGGFSGFEISEDGRDFVALSDLGRWTNGRFERDDAGRIIGFTADPLEPLRDPDGNRLIGGAADSEGLAVAPDGTLYASFEIETRILRYDSLDGPATSLPSPSIFKKMRSNRSLEALAVDGRGWLYTLPEETMIKGADFPLFVFDGQDWHQPVTIPRRGNFLPVGADFGPDGRFYLLERAFYGLAGFATRVRVFTLADDRISAEETVLQTEKGRHDNLEGLAVWRDPDGHIRLTMVSDDNHVFFLRNEIVEYRLPIANALPIDTDAAES